MKRIILLYVLNVVLILLYTTSSLVGQIIDAKYLTPKFIDNTNNYSYTIFGSPGQTNAGGFLFNYGNNNYGNGNEFVVYSFNGDLNISAGSGDISFYLANPNKKMVFSSDGSFNVDNYIIPGNGVRTNRFLTSYFGEYNPDATASVSLSSGNNSNYGFIGHNASNTIYGGGQNFFFSTTEDRELLLDAGDGKIQIFPNGSESQYCFKGTGDAVIRGELRTNKIKSHEKPISVLSDVLVTKARNIEKLNSFTLGAQNRISATTGQVQAIHNSDIIVDEIYLNDEQAIQSWRDLSVSPEWNQVATKQINMNGHSIYNLRGLSGSNRSGKSLDLDFESEVVFEEGVRIYNFNNADFNNLQFNQLDFPQIFVDEMILNGESIHSWGDIPTVGWDHDASGNDIILNDFFVEPENSSNSEGLRLDTDSNGNNKVMLRMANGTGLTALGCQGAISSLGNRNSIYLGVVPKDDFNWHGAIWFDFQNSWDGFDMEFYPDVIRLTKSVSDLAISHGTRWGKTGSLLAHNSIIPIGGSLPGEGFFFNILDSGQTIVQAQTKQGAKISLSHEDPYVFLGRPELGPEHNQQTIVVGRLIASDNSIAPDYVFNESYKKKMPPLTDIEEYIQEQQHLYGFPAAEEYHNSYNVKEVNFKMIEKTEELFLYTIEQDKILTKQEYTIDDLSKRLNELEKQLLNK